MTAFIKVWRRVLDGLSYPRGVAASLIVALWTVIMSIFVLFLSFFIKNRRVVDFVIVYMWSRIILFLGGVEGEVRGTELVTDSRRGCLILFNHSSHMDIPVLFSYFPRTFRFGAKIELFRVPFFGKAMEVCGVLPIDRGNREKVMKVYEQAASRVADGESFALAPEGTRQAQPRLGPFKRGPFEFAINAGMDIVPVVLAGTFAVMPRNTLWINQGRWKRRVIMEITPRISTTGYTLETLAQLQAKVRDQMLVVHDRLYTDLAGR